MIDISKWIDEFLVYLKDTFGSRIWFVGLQGSYGRKEATESSDIDMVVILDTLSCADIEAYNAMLNTLPHRELICGFLGGKSEILSWEPSDLFQFYYDTTPLQGSLDELLPLLDKDAVRRASLIGACNIYHGCVHNILYEKSEEILKDLYKGASFVLRANLFLKTGRYVKYQSQLLMLLDGEEKEIMDSFLKIQNKEAVDFVKSSETLFLWAQNVLCGENT